MAGLKVVGFQIVETESDNPPTDMTTYEVFPLLFVLAWFSRLSEAEKPNWRLLPIFDGDVEEAEFPLGQDQIRV